MAVLSSSIRRSLLRQANHWLQAASRLSVLDQLASENAWHGIDNNIGLVLKKSLRKSIEEVLLSGRSLKKQLEATDSRSELGAAQRNLIQLRSRYLKVEQTIHFYTLAINSRTTSSIAALLRACDILCYKSMRQLLQQLGKDTPFVLTYLDIGAGASILKAGLTLWDGEISPLAAIKVTAHNLFRPTAIIHETGHQVAQITNWNQELAMTLNGSLLRHDPMVRTAYGSWASEIAADAFAFVHTGYAAVAALHDVVSGPSQSVFGYYVSDPHPISYVRVLLNIEMCRQFYGAGPWDDLEAAFREDYPLENSGAASVPLIRKCVEAIPDAVRLILKTSYHAFGNAPLSRLIDPSVVSPKALEKLEFIAGPALFTSHAWIWQESLKLLALNGYRIAMGEGDVPALYKQQEEWMIRLGFSVDLN